MIDKTIGIASMEKFDNRLFNTVGSSRIRVRWLLPFWEEAEEFIIGKKYEILIFQKVYWLSMMKKFTGIKIMDLADPDWLENKPVFEYIDMADGVVTSTQPLADYIKKLRPKALVKCIPDRILLSEAKPVKKEHNRVLKTLVWYGYSQNAHYLYSTFDEIIKRGLELTIISNEPFNAPSSYKNNLKIHNIPWDYETINKYIIDNDAVLMPDPVGDQKSRYKSNNKTIQAWSLGMPVIKVPEDLEKFLMQEDREKESKRVRKEIEDNWLVQKSVEEYREFILKVKERKNGKK